MFRQAVPGDLDQIAAIYDAIHTEEETGRAAIGWIRAICKCPFQFTQILIQSFIPQP